MKASFDGIVMQKDFVYETIPFMSVDIPEDVERQLGIKPKDRLLVRMPGAHFHTDTFGPPGNLAFTFPPEIGRTLSLRNKHKVKFEVEPLQRPEKPAKR
ncbi:MAG TPA: hypothetical protein VGB42_08540 [Candidatus Thermoplasmatota archaeon]